MVVRVRAVRPKKLTQSEIEALMFAPGTENCVISIDQSYTNTGVSVVNGKNRILFAGSLSFKREAYVSSDRFSDGKEFEKKLEKWEKRLLLVTMVLDLIDVYHPIAIVFEQPRRYTRKEDKKASAEANDLVMKDTSNLFIYEMMVEFMCSVIDAVSKYSIPAYSIDTRSWKAAAFNNASHSKEKTAADISLQLGRTVDHDTADACGIGIATFNRNVKKRREE